MSNATPKTSPALAATPLKAAAPGALGAIGALALLLLSLAFPWRLIDPGEGLDMAPQWWWQGEMPWPLLGLGTWALLTMAGGLALRPTPGALRTSVLVSCTALGAVGLLALVPRDETATTEPALWMAILAFILLASATVQRVARLATPGWLSPLTAWLFGLWVLVLWELLVSAWAVPRVLMPAPSAIGSALVEHAAKLGGDLVQTVGKAVLTGYVLGSSLGILTGIAIDRLPWLQRGLLPVASLSSTVPLVGVAPIAVMWFGFGWASKAAVVVLMTFFPALIGTLAGLAAAGRLERELMYSYAAGYGRTLLSLRLPAAMPFIFNALKVNATLALIGAIVAEFFGSPTTGLGFRISTEASRMNMPLVWSAIAVASVVGSLLYAGLSALERRINFWHPAVRHG